MSDKKKALSRIRTFASDVAKQRSQSNQSGGTTNNPATSTADTVGETEITTKAKSEAHFFAKAAKGGPDVGALTTPEEVEAIPEPVLPFSKPAPHLPAFHELQKELAKDISSETNHVSQIHKDTTPIMVPVAAVKQERSTHPKPTEKKSTKPSLAGGTIITDTKKGDFNLFSSTIDSLTNWFSTLAKAFKSKPKPTYSVPSADRRKGVIKKATSKSGAIFTADNETLREEIRRRQQTKVSRPDISWSANTEAGYPLLEGAKPEQPKINNVKVFFKRQATKPIITEPTPLESTPVAPAPVQPEPTFIEEPEPTPVPVPQVELAPMIPESPEEELEPIITEPPTQTSEITVTRSDLPVITQSLLSRIKHKINRLDEINTNLLSVGVLGLCVILAGIFFTANSAVTWLTPSTEVPTTTNIVAPLLTRATVVTTAIPETETIPTALRALNETRPNGITEIRIVADSQREFDPQFVLNQLAFRTNPNFNQAVTDVRFISIDGVTRGILAEVTDPTIAFGTLLEWEPLLAADMSVLFPTQNMFSNGSRFTDKTISSSDVRILTNDSGEILVYGFIDTNLLLITLNTALYTSLLEAK